MHRLWASSIFQIVVLLAMTRAARLAGAEPDFERDVAPILVQRCLECHHEREPAGELVLAHAAGARKGGGSGTALVAGDPDGSLLIQRLRAGEMPPPKQGRTRNLPDAEIEILAAWVRGGVKWPETRQLDLFERTTSTRAGRDWWSLQPIRAVTAPTVVSSNFRNPIDAFILARLESEKMVPAPQADRRTLARRAYFDVTGLAPNLDDLRLFEGDDSPSAYEKLVDRLLSSPRYGERWARHWLDVARFAETCGYERDQEKPGAWRYRDWVVAAFNDDKPFDQFIVEQIAGDTLLPRSDANFIATGFLRLGTWNDEPNDPQEYKYERLEDLVHVTFSAFAGLTVKCARCHDHKFDPISQVDYYRAASAFWPGPIEPRDAKWLGGPSPEELGSDVLAWTDVREPTPLRVLKKGDPRQPLQAVTPGPLSAVVALRGADRDTFNDKSIKPRGQLAAWFVDERNPLTARVIVNRLWLHHFGQGLVRTPNDFGFNSDPPTHPELLDWLASELIRSGWSLKHVHRLMLTSRTYQQASLHPRAAEFNARDAGNRWWWRAERRRLDAEQLHDALLAAADRLDLRLGGPSFRPTISPEALEGLSRKANAWRASPPRDQLRRGLYIFTQRSLLPPLLTTFDFADTTLPCGQRDVTIVAPQALALLNNPFMHEQSLDLARQLVARHVSVDEQIRALWQRTLGRSPSDAERQAAHEHLAASGEGGFASLCHVLLNMNEFVYVD